MYQTRMIVVGIILGVVIAVGVFALMSNTYASPETAYEVAAQHEEKDADQPKQGDEKKGEPAVKDAGPLQPPKMPRTAPGMANLLGDRYWYLPYAVVNEEQGLAFVEAYKDILAEGKKPPETLEVPDGKGAGGGDTLYRLQPGVTDMFITDINNPAATAVTTSEIPVMVAQPRPGATTANVLYMDGHVEQVPWGEFPITRDFIAALSELDPPEYVEPVDEGE